MGSPSGTRSSICSSRLWICAACQRPGPNAGSRVVQERVAHLFWIFVGNRRDLGHYGKRQQDARNERCAPANAWARLGSGKPCRQHEGRRKSHEQMVCIHSREDAQHQEGGGPKVQRSGGKLVRLARNTIQSVSQSSSLSEPGEARCEQK